MRYIDIIFTMIIRKEICILVMIWLIDSCMAAELKQDILRSVNAAVTGSSQHSDQFALSHATDGSKSNISSCSCCAATIIELNPWIKIDLGRLYRISRLEVMGRIDQDDKFSGMNIYIHQMSQTNSYTDLTIISSVTRKYYNYTLAYPSIGQYVTLELLGNHLLCVCEVTVFSRDCSAGTYGAFCNETCGYCQEGQICDRVTGFCTRCMPGYQMKLCKDYCTAGRFGDDCLSTCYCYDSKPCNHVTGECPNGKCGLGWKGDTCSIECEPGTFGSNCQQQCGHCYGNEICDRKDGKCTLCAAGYVGGQHCNQDCSAGTYGPNCSESCGQCLGTEVCNHVTGTCRECDVGYRGATCKEVCPSGSFGRKCSASCHCYNDLSCHYVMGNCPENECDLGWHGDNCSQVCHAGTFGRDCSLTCGQCTEPCDIITGVCLSDCLPGFKGPFCYEACGPRSYGHNCSMPCGHCAGTCDAITGRCLAGCLPGYEGDLCKEDYNIIEDVSVKLSMSSVYQGLDATKAVDGNYHDSEQGCRCCSETKNGDISWWQAEFRTPKFIKQINVYGRLNERTVRQLTGFKLFISMTRQFSERPVYVHNEDMHGNKILVYLPDVAVKFLKIQRVGILTICEIEIFQSGIKCPVNTYGHSCMPCGYCKNGTCEQVTGQCPDACDENFDGDLCMTPKKQQSTQTLAVVGGLVGIIILLVIGLSILGVVLLQCWKRRVTEYEESLPKVRWRIRQTGEYATIEVPELPTQPRPQTLS